MARIFVKYEYTYQTDLTTVYTHQVGRFVLPPDLNFFDGFALATATGGNYVEDNMNFCTDKVDGRKLIFYRSNRNSFTLRIATDVDVYHAATGVRDYFKIFHPNYPIVCIKLEGEHLINLETEYNLSKTISPGISSRGLDAIQNVYSGRLNYQTNLRQVNLDLPFKFNTNEFEQYPEQYRTEIASCLQEIESVYCRSLKFRHRRFKVTSLVAEPLKPVPANKPYPLDLNTLTGQFLEVPVTTKPLYYRSPVTNQLEFTPNDIYNCGQLLANNPATQCLEYCGESFDYIQKFLTPYRPLRNVLEGLPNTAFTALKFNVGNEAYRVNTNSSGEFFAHTGFPDPLQLDIDLGTPYLINIYQITAPPQQAPQSVSFSLSNDGVNFITIRSFKLFKNPLFVLQEFRFICPQIAARYVRVSGSKNLDFYAQINNLKIYGVEP